MRRELAIVDFETFATVVKHYPPKPVSLAISAPGMTPEFYAWGHPEGNNCSEERARARYAEVCRDYDILCHNAQFDLHVGRKHWSLFPQHDYHCSMVMRFLTDPHAPSLGLKESAQAMFEIAPEERDELHSWIRNNVPKHLQYEVQGFGVKAKKKRLKPGALIAYAPGNMVEAYALQDVNLPRLLFEKLWPQITDDTPDYEFQLSLMDAYKREMDMLLVCLDMNERGVNINCARLEEDVKLWQRQIEELGIEIRRILNCGESVNLDSDKELAEALESAGKIAEWVLTPTGKRSVSADSLKIACNDPDLLHALDTRAVIENCLNTFGLNWLNFADSNGRVHPQWNSTRRDDTTGGYGARTARLSSTPNFQNIIKIKKSKHDPRIPNLRVYIVPENGHTLLDRDYSSQEFRALAHFEAGPLMNAYLANPAMDIHEQARQMMNAAYGLGLTEEDRTLVKIMGFGLIYGMGIGLLASTMGKSISQAKSLKDAYLGTFPGLPELMRGLKARARDGRPIRTVGGRLYYCELPKIIDGKLRTFDYKLLNYLIQGSSADLTKSAMIACYKAGLPLILTVHDQLIVEVLTATSRDSMALLKDCMERRSIQLDVEQRSEGKSTVNSWGEMEKYDDNYKEAA